MDYLSILNSIYSQVMEAKIPVEISIFCSFIERICGSLIVYDRCQRTGSLHGVTLPRSWLKVILDTFQSTEKDTSHFWLLLQPLERLLRTQYYNNFLNPGKIYCLGSNYRCEELIYRNRTLMQCTICNFGELSSSATTSVAFILLECESKNFGVGMPDLKAIL